jgi:hypothetical protein
MEALLCGPDNADCGVAIAELLIVDCELRIDDESSSGNGKPFDPSQISIDIHQSESRQSPFRKRQSARS